MVAAFLRLMCLALALLAPAYAEGPVAGQPFHFPVAIADATVAPGGTVQLRVTITVPEGTYVYKDTVSVTTVDAGTWTVGAPSYPPGLTRPDPATPGATREQYESDVLIDVPVTAPADASGRQPVTLRVHAQGCKKNLCYFPQDDDVTALVGVVAAAAAPAPPTPPGEEVSVRMQAREGGPDTATVHLDLQGDWHLNRAMMWVSLSPPPAEGEAAPWTLGEPCMPPGVKTGSEADGTAREDLHEDFDLVVPVSGAAGKTSLKLEIGYQACKGVSLCKMPTSEVVEVPVVLSGGPAGACPDVRQAAVLPAPPATGGFAAAAAQGTLALVLVCFAAGLAVSLTPCVLPMVPITMGIIGARGAGSRLKAISLAGTYVLGLALVYTALGIVFGMTGQLFGSWQQSVWLMGGIAAVFFVMGLAMFGIIDVGVPSAIASRLSGKGGGGGYGGAFVLGMIGAVLAGPCSGPVVASILALISQAGASGDQGGLAFGGALMFAFSLGMGMIFLVTGAASGWLPSRGPWMVVVKKSFGVALWLTAIYYVAPHLSTETTALLTAAVLLSTAVFAWPSEEDGEGWALSRTRQLYAVVAVLVGGYLLVGTLMRTGFILPPAALASSATAPAGITWISEESVAVERALAEGKPLMIDFTAEWCAACHEMEKYTYTDGAVIAEAGGFVTVMIDCTEKSDPAVVAIQKKYGVLGLPTVVFAKPDGTKVGETIGFVKPAEFLPQMKAARAAAG